jgi:hypothetical protein
MVCLAALAWGVALGAGQKSDPGGDVMAAVAKVGDAGSYSWTRVTDDVSSGGARMSESGKTDTSGYTLIDLNSGGFYLHVAFKGSYAVVNAGQGWKSLDDMADQRQAVRAVSRIVRGLKSPVMIARDIVSRVGELKRDGEMRTAELTGDDASELLGPVFDMRGRDMTDPKVTVKFWVRDGALTRYELRASVNVSRQGVATEVSRAISVEFSNVGSTKVEVPDEAKGKLG